MHFRGIGTAHPPARFTKAECLAAFQRSDWFGRLDARSHFIARTVLQRDNGIEARCRTVRAMKCERASSRPNQSERWKAARHSALVKRAGG